jgi:archaemetzincin
VQTITLVAIGVVPSGFSESLSPFLSQRTRTRVEISDRTVDPTSAYNGERGQYNSRQLLPVLDEIADGLGTRVLGMADVDLYSPIFTFVFGETRLGGKTGLFSLHRLRPTLYGLPDDLQLFRSRARKEALHETGHLLGLVHCPVPECVMRFSASVEEVDLKSDAFCPACAAGPEDPV